MHFLHILEVSFHAFFRAFWERESEFCCQKKSIFSPENAIILIFVAKIFVAVILFFLYTNSDEGGHL